MRKHLAEPAADGRAVWAGHIGDSPPPARHLCRQRARQWFLQACTDPGRRPAILIVDLKIDADTRPQVRHDRASVPELKDIPEDRHFYLGRDKSLTPRNAAELGSFIGKINALANAALQRKEGSEQEYLANLTQSLGQKPWGRWVEALRECARAQVLSWQDGATEITFASAEAAQFLRGGWLEEYALYKGHPLSVGSLGYTSS